VTLIENKEVIKKIERYQVTSNVHFGFVAARPIWGVLQQNQTK